ncbi:MAG: hypothetical protein ACYTEE_05500 [Planctomycetota bacterium]|jgi:hypothetical protein
MNGKKIHLITILICLFCHLTAVAKQPSEASGRFNVTNDNQQMSVNLKVTDDDGFLRCTSSDNDTEMYIEVEYSEIDGKYAWFAGICTEDGANFTGKWLFGAVHDGGTPGKLVDHVWWEWLPDSDDVEDVAKSKVENLEIPADNKPIGSGDIKVNDYD